MKGFVNTLNGMIKKIKDFIGSTDISGISPTMTGAIAKINSDLSANNGGNVIYITSTNYTFPDDGYITIVQGGGVPNWYTDAIIKGANDVEIARLFVRVHTSGELSDIVSLMVRKGMKVSLTFSDSTAKNYASITFKPFIG